MKIIYVLGIFICTSLPHRPVSCEHLYLQMIQNVYKTFENIIIKMDMFKLMQFKRDLSRYRAYKCLVHNFTGVMDNMWVGTGANDPQNRSRRLFTRMTGVELAEYYTKMPRYYEFRGEVKSLKRLRYSLYHQQLRKWNCGQAAINHAKSMAAKIPELNLTLAHLIFNEMDDKVTTPLLVTTRRSTRPWVYGLEKLQRKKNMTVRTPNPFPRRKLTVHLLFRYTGVFRENMPPRYPGFTNPPGMATPSFHTTIQRIYRGGVLVNATRRIYGRHFNSTGIHKRKLFHHIPQRVKPFYKLGSEWEESSEMYRKNRKKWCCSGD